MELIVERCLQIGNFTSVKFYVGFRQLRVLELFEGFLHQFGQLQGPADGSLARW